MQIAPLKLESMNCADFLKCWESLIAILCEAHGILEDINFHFDAAEVNDILNEYAKAVNFMAMDHEDFDEYISDAVKKIEDVTDLLEAKFYLGQLDQLKDTIKNKLKDFQ